VNNLVVVGMADCVVSRDSKATLITYALGSCIAVSVYDPVIQVGGLLHYVLPDSANDLGRARANPAFYADTGIAELLLQVYDVGAEKTRLKVRIAGGARVLEDGKFFNIGSRNFLAVKKLLWQAGILIEQASVGGNRYRTLGLRLSDGSHLLQEGDMTKAGDVPTQAVAGSAKGAVRAPKLARNTRLTAADGSSVLRVFLRRGIK